MFAILRYAKISSQKSVLVANQIRGLLVSDALNILNFSFKKSAIIIKKLLQSAIVNAKCNNNFNINELKITKIIINKAPSLKKTRCKAKGKGTRILKKNCHIYIYLNKL